MSRLDEPGWVQIGEVCPAGRRSLWVRITRTPSVNRFADNDAYQIELCAGRVGEDNYVSFTRGADLNDDEELVQFENLEDVLSTAVWVHTLIEEDKEYQRAMNEDMKTKLRLELIATGAIAEALKPLDGDARCRVVAAAAMLLDMDLTVRSPSKSSTPG